MTCSLPVAEPGLKPFHDLAGRMQPQRHAAGHAVEQQHHRGAFAGRLPHLLAQRPAGGGLALGKTVGGQHGGCHIRTFEGHQADFETAIAEAGGADRAGRGTAGQRHIAEARLQGGEHRQRAHALPPTKARIRSGALHAPDRSRQSLTAVSGWVWVA